MLKDRKVVLVCNGEAYLLTSTDGVSTTKFAVESLQSSQEETDTGLFLYWSWKDQAYQDPGEEPETLRPLSRLGDNWTVSDDLVAELESFTCALYGQSRLNSVDLARYTKINALCHSDNILPSRNIDMGTFPPCKRSLVEHIRRVNFQKWKDVWSHAGMRGECTTASHRCRDRDASDSDATDSESDEDGRTPSGAIVQPGGVRTYCFTVPNIVAPTKLDTDCLTYMYHSAVHLNKDFDSGLIGPMLVCKRGTLAPNGKQIRVDREFFVFYASMDENNSWYFEENIRRYTRNSSLDREDADFIESNEMKGINGRMYGNLEGLDMCVGETISWHIFGMGHTLDLYGFQFKGNDFRFKGSNRDSYVVIPGQSMTAIMRPDNPGRWSFATTVFNYLDEGASALYNVRRCGQSPIPPPIAQMTGRVRRYYIAAVEIDWDYAPMKLNIVTGENMTDPNVHGHEFVRNDDTHIGSVYRKAVYREYTDSTFRYLKTRGQRDIHLGIMGPCIKAEVGDTVEVVFLNRASIPLSVTSHGVFSDKFNDGTNYMDNVGNTRDNSVEPGRTFTYRWLIPERSGPSPTESNCIGMPYHSGVDYQGDTYAGLVGTLVLCRRGILDANGRRRDGIDREFSTLYLIYNENESPYFEQNVRRFAPRQQDLTEGNFRTSNTLDTINGFIHGNLPGLVMLEGETVAWYVLGMGTNIDGHTAHFHGQTFLHRQKKVHRGDVIEVFPGTYETVEMLADNPGTWIYHCHLSLHMRDGMASTFTVLPRRSRLADASLLFAADGVSLPPGYLAPFNAMLRKEGIPLYLYSHEGGGKFVDGSKVINGFDNDQFIPRNVDLLSRVSPVTNCQLTA
ncbi:hypothetical protein ScPMuIL_002031 [Solemya velum]